MSLFGSIQIAGNSLLVSQIGLQVTGQNIANVNTPHYAREELALAPAATQRFGSLTLGLGVEAKGVVQKIDRFLEARLRGASSDRASADTQKEVLAQLEQVVGELQDTDLSTSLSNFFSSINDVLNQPESVSARSLAVSQGKNLAGDFNRLAERVQDLRQSQNDQVVRAAADINRLVSEVSQLNIKIAQSEASDLTTSDAVGLRDERSRALADLSELVEINTEEQSNGMVNVFVGGDYLVFGSITRQIEATYRSDRGMTVADLQIASSQSQLPSNSGRIAGLLVARDEALGGFQDQLNDLADTLSFEFNKVFSSGQGLKGYTNITSQAAVASQTAALDAAGLPFTPVNGSFQVQIYDRSNNTTQTRTIAVELNGLHSDTSLDDLAAQLNAVPGLSATITAQRQLRLQTTVANQEVTFANDSSGALAALGLGTFFTGKGAADLGVNQAVVADPARFAASNTGIGAGTGQAALLAQFLDQPLESADGNSLRAMYTRMVAQTSEASASASAAATGYQTFEQNLLSQHMAVSGVNLDEEALKLMQYERMYQASARFIATINGLLELLTQL